MSDIVELPETVVTAKAYTPPAPTTTNTTISAPAPTAAPAGATAPLDRPSIGEVSIGRRPRGLVTVDDQQMSFLSFNVERRAHFAVDIWSVDFELWQQPEGFDISYWADAQGSIVEITAGFLDAAQDVGDPELTSTVLLIVGQVDDVDLNLLTGEGTISGRSMAAKLVDNKTTDKWLNRTASQIVTLLGQEQGLIVDADPTTVEVGNYYDNEYAMMDRNITEWELCVFLAEREGFDLWVFGTTLYFKMPVPDPNPFQLWVGYTGDGTISSNCTHLVARRSLTLSQDITVTVISHDYWTDAQIKGTATRVSRATGGSQKKIAPNTKQSYILRRPGLTQEQATQLANSTLANLTKHERVLEYALEGNPDMTPQRQVQLTNTGTAFDQLYYIDKISHKLSFNGGYEMTGHAKNIPPTSTSGLVAGTPADINPPVSAPDTEQ